MNLIKKWFLKRAIKKKLPSDDLDALILEELKEAKKNNTMRGKLLKLRMAQQIKNESLDEMRQDIEGENEEPEAAEGIEEMLIKTFLPKLLGSAATTQGGAAPTANFGEIEEQAKTAGISPEQIAKFKEEFPLK